MRADDRNSFLAIYLPITPGCQRQGFVRSAVRYPAQLVGAKDRGRAGEFMQRSAHVLKIPERSSDRGQVVDNTVEDGRRTGDLRRRDRRAMGLQR